MKEFLIKNIKILKIIIALVIIFLAYITLNSVQNNKGYELKNAKLVSEKKVFSSYETPKFKVTFGETKKIGVLEKVFAAEEPSLEAEFTSINDNKTQIEADISKDTLGTYSISFPTSYSFKPGQYTLSANLKTEDGERNFTQDFTWGVLALNPNKTIYKPFETANIAIGVLDERGEMVCNADVTLTITKPNGTKEEKKTNDNSIKVTSQCHSKEASIEPDYATSFMLTDIGTYTLDLSAKTKNGTYRVQDFVKVSTDIPFDIERSSATRLYPRNEYPMTINITANKDYKGVVSETIPSNFAIIKSKQDNKETDYAAKIIEQEGFRLINWQVDWKKGEKYTLSYVYKAPSRSPDFFLLGNLTLENGFKEGRFWQLANDAIVATLTTADTSPWDVPGDWNDADNTIEVVGAGGNGVTSTSLPGGGGGGGAYAATTSLNLAEGGTANFQIGSGGSGTATWFSASGTVNAGAGANASGRTHGNGGTATAGSTQTSGGNGGDGGNLAGAGGGGGGGAAGPNGVGRVGGSGIATGATGGGGGGGNGGGSDGSAGTNPNGGNGGDGNGASGGGAGGAGAGGNATTNSGGGGAGGAGTTASGGAFAGGTGAASTDISGASTGTGGGGGGGGGNTRTSGTNNNGGTGGLITANTGAGGGGGGDCTDAGCTEGVGQTGSDGFIVVSYNPAGVNVSGNIYSTGTTPSTECDANAGTFELSLRTNGATYTASCSNSDGSFTFSGVIPGAAGTGIIIWINGLTTDGAIAIRYDGTGDSTSNIFYDNVLTVTSDDTNGVDILDMNTYDNADDGDIPYTATDATPDTLSVNSGFELLIKIKSGVSNGSTVFAPSGTVTTDATGGVFHIDDNSAANLDTATNAIGTDITIDTGATLTISGSTTVGGGDITATGTLATSGTPTVTIRGTGSISGAGTKTIYNLTVGDGTTATTSLTGTLSISNDASVGTGSTFNINANLTVTGSLTNTTTGIINHTANSPIVTVSGSSIGGGSGNITFYRLQKAGAGTTTFSGSGTNAINNTLDATAGTLTLSTNNDITVTGNVSASNSATINQNTALIINGGSLLTSGSGVINTTAGTSTVTISGTGNIGGGGTVTVYNLTVDGNQTLASETTSSTDVSVSTGATLALSNQNLTLSGGDLATAGTGAVTCTSCNAGTLTISGTGNIGGGGTVTVYNLTSSSGTQTVSSALTALNNLTANGTINGSSNVTVNADVAGTGTINMSGGTFEQRVSADENFGTTSGSNAWSFSTLLFSNGSGTNRTITTQTGGSGAITASTLLQLGKGGDSNATLLNAGNRTWTLSGTSGTPFNIVSPSSSTSFTASTSIMNYTGANGGGNTTIEDVDYNNLTINASDTFVAETSPLDINGDLNITSGTLSMSANDLNVGSSSITDSGDIIVTGTITQSASGTTAVKSSSAGTATVGGSGTITFYNLTFTPTVASEPTFTLGDGASQTITVNGTLTVGNGTNGVTVTGATNNPTIDINGSLSILASGVLIAPGSSSFTIAGDMTNNGTFTHSSGTINFNGSGVQTINGSGTPAITFHNLTLSSGQTVKFTAGKTFRTNGLFTVSGSTSIDSTTSSQWFINHQGTETASAGTVSNSGCDGTSTDVDISGNDGGNNGTCWIFSVPIINSRVKGSSRIEGNTRIK